jgi:hypothetical protein
MSPSMYVTGPYRQRGRGLGGLLGSLFRSVLPALKTFGQSALVKGVGKTLLNSAAQGGLKLVTDALDGGKDLKAGVKSSIAAGRAALSKTIKEHTSGAKGRKKRPPPPPPPPPRPAKKKKLQLGRRGRYYPPPPSPTAESGESDDESGSSDED